MIVSYSKRKVEWIPYGETTPIVLDSIVSISTNRNFEPRNNSCKVKLNYTPLLFSSGGVFLPQENDVFYVYEKTITDANDTEFETEDRIWIGKFVDKDRSTSPDSSIITLNITDFTYDVFNKFNKINYYNSGYRTNEIIEHAVRQSTEDLSGYGINSLDYSQVASLRNDGSLFPVPKIASIRKPMYEFIQLVGQITNTNSSSETTPIITRDMIFDIKGNNVIWKEQPEGEEVIIDPEIYTILDVSEKGTNESSANKLFLDCGEDFEGRPITIYIYDVNGTSKIEKETGLKKESIAGLNRSYDNEFHFLRAEYDLATNTEFRIAVREKAREYSNFWFKTVGRPRVKTNITLGLTNDFSLGMTVMIGLANYADKIHKVVSITTESSSSTRTTSLELEELI